MKSKPKTRMKTKRTIHKYPQGWNRKSIQELVDHYENQTEEEAVSEDEAAFKDPHQTVMLVPRALVPKFNKLLAAHAARK